MPVPAIAGLLAWLSGSAVAKWIGTKALFFFLFTVVLPLVLVNVAGFLGGLYLDRITDSMNATDSVSLATSPLTIWLVTKLRIVETITTVLTIGLTSRLIRTVG